MYKLEMEIELKCDIINLNDNKYIYISKSFD